MKEKHEFVKRSVTNKYNLGAQATKFTLHSVSGIYKVPTEADVL